MIYSNIVSENKVREIQKETLNIISNALLKSFGPNGSNTAIIKNIDKNGVNISVEYTKDGHTIVKNIEFYNTIERSVQDILTELTRHIVKKVGDGTTSAILLCNTLFNALCEACDNDNNLDPYSLMRQLKDAVDLISKKILSKKKECTLKDIYQIAYISTNGNEEIAGTIREIYKKFGMGVLIDVGISNEVDNIVKEYDGMTLSTGYSNICFINEASKNKATIKNPKIYCFADPIDTPEMLSFLDKIIYDNILRCYYNKNDMHEPVPTVIFCKSISPDASSYLETVVKLMNANPGQVPLLIVSDIHQEYLYEDIAKMCGAPFIKKYLNPDIQNKDIEAGLAPTLDTITTFSGRADMVQSDQYKTKIINPVKMFNEDGSYSDDYNNMITYLEAQVQQAINEDAGIEQIARTKRRLNSFKGNMVDFLIGGITVADRNTLKASVEDAVLNCRSAAENGVGYGANYMAFKVLHELDDKSSFAINILKNAYDELVKILYGTVFKDENIRDMYIAKSLSVGFPIDFREKKFNSTVKASIKSDIVVLETVTKMLSLMFTCNQYLLQTPSHNVYTIEN